MKETVCIVGLGYVGLPLALEFAKKCRVIGFDVGKEKIELLQKGRDLTKSVSANALRKSKIEFSADETAIKKADFVIVAVPTPLKSNNEPDLRFLQSASEIVGRNLKKKAIVVFESTVYPGVTEEFCLPIIEKASGLSCPKQFKIGYSPERVNPGDKKHSIEKITKLVSGIDAKATEKIAKLYKKVIQAGVVKTTNIKTAEAAKLIENTQRDLNIALMNELSLIFSRMKVNTLEVIEAASTKWNFHKYSPGLVGGHCISVDPHYLLFKARQLGYEPKVVLAGRTVNNFMPKFVAQMAEDCLRKQGTKVERANALVLGLTFKANVNDTRDSRSKEVIEELKLKGLNVVALDPRLSTQRIKKEFGVKAVKLNQLKRLREIDVLLLLVDHNEFKKISLKQLKKIMKKPVLIDIKGIFQGKNPEKEGFIYKTL